MTSETDISSDITKRRGIDLPQAAFWAAAGLGILAAGVAITGGREAGQAGAILLILLLAGGLVLFAFVSRGIGRQVGAFPERGAMERAALFAHRAEFLVLDALEEPALVTDRDGSPIAANAAYIAVAEIAGALGDSDRPPMMSRLFGADPLLSAPMFRLSRAAGTGQSRREELPTTALSPSGAPTRYEARVSSMAGGRVLWRLREIGENAEQNEDLRHLFLDDAPVGFFAAREDGTIAYMNRALRAVLGIGDDPAKLKVKDVVRDETGRLMRRERRGFGPTQAPVTLRARDGVEAQASALTFWAAGESDAPIRTLVFFTEAEAPSALPRSERRAPGPGDVMFEHAPFGAALLDGPDPSAAAILDTNPALTEMSQGRATPGATFAELFDASEGPSALAQRLRSAATAPVDLQLAGTSPTAVHVQLARGADGSTLAYVINVSEQRELEQRLAQSEKMREIGMLAGGVAHDFNNLLTAVMNNCDYLLRRHPVGDPDYLDLNEINHHALRAKELSEMLRAYARQTTFKREVLDVSDFLSRMQELIRRLIGEAISFDMKHGRDLPMIKADRTQLERVLVNLASNARDAMSSRETGMPRGGRLVVRTLNSTAEEARAHGHLQIADGQYVLIEVEDTGSGIKPEDAAKIFRPFHSTKEAGKGTGLGLATSYGIIKQSGGYIFFDSRPGKGTTFRVYLPAYEPSQEEIDDMAKKERERIDRPATDVAGQGRILFVEDQVGVRRAIARNLVECGYEVVEAEHGEEALAILDREPGSFDVIITDYDMPVMNGPEMVEAATVEMIGGAKILFLSGYAPESFGKILEDVTISYLSKPVNLAQLASKVKSLMAA
ncbi:MAG: response regulator [Hyphomonadaceae bacterium]|nr:response regulator [Hyphomonadaceae bacterium]